MLRSFAPKIYTASMGAVTLDTTGTTPANSAAFASATNGLPQPEGLAFLATVTTPVAGTGSVVMSLQDSPDGTTWTDCDDLTTDAPLGYGGTRDAYTNANKSPITINAANGTAATTFKIGYIGQQPNVRVLFTTTGTLSAGAVSVTAVAFSTYWNAPWTTSSAKND